MLGRETTAIPFSTEAMKANLLRLQNEWESVQASHHRDAIYWYLASVFEMVMWWNQESKAVNRARRALHLCGHHSDREPEPFAAVILCTADRDQVDDRTRSKWSRVLRYAAEHKDLYEPLRDFIKRKGGINRCAARFARRLRRGRRLSYGLAEAQSSCPKEPHSRIPGRACRVVTDLRQA
jgi:hypothetical protein